MEIKQLRIGNLILDPDGYQVEVTELSLESIGTEDSLFHAEDANGIELTPEWLTRFGWGKSEEHEMGHNSCEPWGFYYDYHFKRFRIENSDTDWDVEMPNVKYLHQVQNLIFSLTGEELAIDKTSLKN